MSTEKAKKNECQLGTIRQTDMTSMEVFNMRHKQGEKSRDNVGIGKSIRSVYYLYVLQIF